MTNLELLKSEIIIMTSEELGDFLYNIRAKGCSRCIYSLGDTPCTGKSCKEGFIEWSKLNVVGNE